MGDPRRLRKQYETPRKVWDDQRIEEEKSLLIEYGLRSMHELWRMEAELKKLRRSARALLAVGDRGKEKAAQILAKAQRYGFTKEGATLDDLLALTVRNILERRLQTLVVKKGFARSMLEARQLITHRKIKVSHHVVASPGYLVPLAEENTIMRV